jgi:Tol biopolymer transport system component
MAKKWVWVGVAVLAIVVMAVVLSIIFSYNDPYRDYTGLDTHLSITSTDDLIYFSYFKEGTASIFQSDIDGQNIKRVTQQEEEKRHIKPVVTPDGKSLLYLSFPVTKHPPSTLMLMDMDTKAVTALTEGSTPILEAIFSPDGQTIYFTEGEDYGPELAVPANYDLYAMKIDGSNRRKLNDNPIFLMESLSISPDGRTLYFSSTDTEEFHPVFQSLEVNTTVTQTYPIGEHSYPVVSPDGKFIYYSTPSEEYEQNFEYEVFSYHIKSGEKEQLTAERSALFSPVFFHNKKEFLVFEQVNWPNHPEKYMIRIFTNEGQPVKEVPLNIPEGL